LISGFTSLLLEILKLSTFASSFILVVLVIFFVLGKVFFKVTLFFFEAALAFLAETLFTFFTLKYP